MRSTCFPPIIQSALSYCPRTCENICSPAPHLNFNFPTLWKLTLLTLYRLPGISQRSKLDTPRILQRSAPFQKLQPQSDPCGFDSSMNRERSCPSYPHQSAVACLLPPDWPHVDRDCSLSVLWPGNGLVTPSLLRSHACLRTLDTSPIRPCMPKPQVPFWCRDWPLGTSWGCWRAWRLYSGTDFFSPEMVSSTCSVSNP